MHVIGADMHEFDAQVIAHIGQVAHISVVYVPMFLFGSERVHASYTVDDRICSLGERHPVMRMHKGGFNVLYVREIEPVFFA
jgi:hypothetical protein